MPSISRARIVNFYYNDGTRFIPDEIIDFCDSEGNTLDTLLDLENGGGKTVLVQLLLQPVIPRAKVQTRRIGDYFRKSSDCAYILLEWKLDRSSDHLLTGIAITSSQSSNESDENRAVKFFTFINHYGHTGDKYDIVNFPLSEREGGRFVPAQFEKVRSMAKSLEYYHSDDVRKYQSRLDEFGIIHSEWENIIVKINEREGGIEQFIEEYNTTNKLLDQFMIPGIMAGKETNNADNESVDTMFMNYAESCAQMSDKIEQRKRIDEFIGQLNELVPQVKQLWNLYDENQSSVRELFDYIVSLKDAISKKKTLLEKLSTEKATAEENKLRIELEKLSYGWYRDTEVKEKEEQLVNELNKKINNANLKKNSAEHNIKVLRAAEKYSELTQQKARQVELQTQLRKLTDSDFDEHKKSVRYSLHVAAEKLLEDTRKKLAELSEKIADNTANINELVEKHNKLLSEHSGLKSEIDKKSGQRDQLDNDISKGLYALNISITKMLDGRYDTKEIEDEKQRFTLDITAMLNESENLTEEYKQNQERIAYYQRRITGLNIEKYETECDSAKVEAELAEYDEKFKVVCDVLISLSMAEKQAFTKEPEKVLLSKIAGLNDEIKACERRKESLSEQKINAEKGNVHIPQSAVDYLDDTGVDYQTGTVYLSEHKELSDRILDVEPLVAFSVIVNDDKARRNIFDSVGEDSWISAAIPVFTISEISDITEGRKASGSEFLAAYSHGYFNDKDSYINSIVEMIDNKNEELLNLQGKLSERESQLSAVRDFDYPESYRSEKSAEQKALSDKLQNIGNEIKKIDDENKNLSERREYINERQKELSKELQQLEQRESRFLEICCKMDEYYNTLSSISKNEERMNCLKNQINSITDSLDELKKKSEEFAGEQKYAAEKNTEYLTVYSETDGDTAELLSEPYDELKAEFDAFRKEFDNDKHRLNNDLEKCSGKIAKLIRRLDDMGVSEEEYSVVEYSEEVYNREEAARADAEDELKKLVRESATHEEKLKQLAEKMLKTENKISDFGKEVLPKSEIGADFDSRIKECTDLIEVINKKIRSAESEIDKHKYELGQSEIIAEKYHDNTDIHHIIEISDHMIEKIRSKIESSEKSLQKAEKDALNWIKGNLSKYSECGLMFKNIIGQLIGFINNETEKDKYFTMNEKLEQDMQNLEKERGRLDTELRDIESSKTELVSHCMQRIKVLYDDLKNLAKKSSVKIFEQNKQMIRIELPEIAQDDTAPKTRMGQYIESSVKEYLNKYEETDIRAREQSVHSIMNYRRLLNCYIGNDEIPVSVYKIGNSAQTSSYRKWENALKANSGGERFVVFFALILSMMNFSRSISNSIKNSSGVLILDNPFGPISSAHLLTPMFEIARKFRIQLICFTHLDTAEIVKCFSNSYKLKLKARPLSNIETLEAEPLQELEHAFYRTEQLSFL